MINPLYQDFADAFPFEPTHEQVVAMNRLASFADDPAERRVFLLKGYAGTGKTLLISTLVRILLRHHRRVVLMAPTGRAAKVFSNASGFPACTIHKKIYRQKSLLDAGSFQLDRNMHEHTLFTSFNNLDNILSTSFSLTSGSCSNIFCFVIGTKALRRSCSILLLLVSFSSICEKTFSSSFV